MKSNRYELAFNQLLDKTEDGFIMVDSNGFITDVNQKYADFLGRKAEEIIGEKIENIISNTKMYAVMNDHYNGDTSYIHHYAEGDTKESESYCAINRFCVVDDNQEVIGAIAQMKFKDRSLDIARKVLLAEMEFYKSELNKSIDKSNAFGTIIGNDPKIVELKKTGVKVAKKDFPVFISGETGTGKELIAKAIHMESPRRDNPLISINCGAIPSELIESELFGYEEGAFTGAKKGGKIGKFLLANNGTIFLDEIGDLPLPLQVKLLRVLQEKEVEPLGSSHPIPINVRVISATRQNLQQMIKDGNFREDLYYRLAVVNIETIPLRDHKDDIMLYINDCLSHLNKKYKTSVTISSEAKKCLVRYNWPGNVRELQNVISSAYAICDGVMIDTIDLSSKIVSFSNNIGGPSKEQSSLKDMIKSYEASLIINALHRNNQNISDTAIELGVERSLLYKKMKNLNIVIEKNIKL